MRKKLLSLLLAVALTMSFCLPAMAADIRETDFFTDQEHADVNFTDMEYRHIEAEPILEEMEAISALAADGANEAEVEERFFAVTDQFMEVLTMYTLIDIRTYQDVYDEDAIEEQEYTDALYYDVADAWSVMTKAILESPCAGFLEEQLTEEDIEYYLSYEEMTQEEKDRAAQETALVNEYYALAGDITVEYNGEEWTDTDAYYAYLDGEISDEDYDAISLDFAKKQNAILGEIYLRMVELRKEIAQADGYDTYTDYAYSEIYDRDYTKEEIRAFHQAVKDFGFYQLSQDLLTLCYAYVDTDVFYGDYTSDIALDMMEPYIGQMSNELLEAFTYMRSHGLFDSGYGDNKADAGFTTLIYGYNAPFYFNSPYGQLYDFTTAVHEFGHYNNFYWQPNGWNDASKNIDLAEVHSQGLELLFSNWYPEIFGENAEAVLDYQMSNLVYSIFSGSLHDELQQYVYDTEDVTLEQINQKYRQLAEEYGMVSPDDPRTEMYGWVSIPHTFTSPCYYISYAVSVAGAFTFWLDAQEGEYYDALDEYLKFTALSADLSFQESFEEMGMDNPLSPAFLEELAAALRTAMDVDARIEAIPEPVYFSDVLESDWFYEYVMFIATYGPSSGMNVTGYEDGTFRPQEAAVMGLLDAEAADPATPILRGDFCRVLALGVLEMTEDELVGGGAPFSDTDDAAVAAVAELGIVNGYGDGTFRPDQPMTRAEFCAAFCRTLQLILFGSLDEAA